MVEGEVITMVQEVEEIVTTALDVETTMGQEIEKIMTVQDAETMTVQEGEVAGETMMVQADVEDEEMVR